MFDLRCQENGIEHRLTKIKHPWTNGQVERLNRIWPVCCGKLGRALVCGLAGYPSGLTPRV
jgi:hypothetical protein